MNTGTVPRSRDLIHGEGYGYHEIEQVIKDFFGL